MQEQVSQMRVCMHVRFWSTQMMERPLVEAAERKRAINVNNIKSDDADDKQPSSAPEQLPLNTSQQALQPEPAISTSGVSSSQD